QSIYCDQNAAATIPSGCPGQRDISSCRTDRRRGRNSFRRPVITAHLVGDEEVLARLRSIPGAVNTGLVRTVTKLGLDLQRRVQDEGLSGETPAARPALEEGTIDIRRRHRGGYVTGARSRGPGEARSDALW